MSSGQTTSKNEALATALKNKGIESDKDRRQFAESVGMSERTLRRWLNEEGAKPNGVLARVVARRLGVKREELFDD